tara:strand:+ start:1886 stop:2122 length:237 start_codon:yes stop_codon:yes gene_type:complete
MKRKEVNEYRFELCLIGLGEDADDALQWAVEQLNNRNTEVVDGEIVYQEVASPYDSKEIEEETVLVKPEEWLTVIPEA